MNERLRSPVDPVSESISGHRPQTMTRRHFISSAVIYAGSLSEKAEAKTPLELPSVRSTVSDHAKTVLEATVMGIASRIANYELHRKGLTETTESMAKDLIEIFHEDGTKKMLLNAGVVYPLAEETVFRLLPSMAADRLLGKDETHYTAGLIPSVLFGYAHNIYSLKPFRLTTSQFPVIHTFLGEWLWVKQRQKGFSHAFVAHSTMNSETVLAMSGLLKLQKKLIKSREIAPRENKGIRPEEV